MADRRTGAARVRAIEDKRPAPIVGLVVGGVEEMTTASEAALDELIAIGSAVDAAALAVRKCAP